jgi:photosystem II PsbY protein
VAGLPRARHADHRPGPLLPPRSLGTIALLFLPALGWVAFNMLGPLTNQLNRMSEMASEDAKPAGKKRRGVAGAVGLGAALALATAQQADAATELAQLGASDGR